MSNSVYQINKGINQSIEFKGLRAQYIWYLGAGVVALMILFAILFFIGIPSMICIIFIGVLGALLVLKIYKMSNQYGEYGLMKTIARKHLPENIKVYSRRVFTK
jgi:xanthosine utilization system XapX-like protein